MNSTDGVLGQLLVLAIVVVGISVILAGAKGPSSLLRFLLRPLLGGICLIFKVALV